MQSPFVESQPTTTDNLLHFTTVLSESDYAINDASQTVEESMRFYCRFEDHMELFADSATVAQYLDDHQSWFRRCAHPMQVESIGRYAYALVIGRFGSFGYEVEPKIGLDLLPQQEGIYRIETVPVPDYVPPGYDVDFQASMELVEATPDEALQREFRKHDWSTDQITRVQWVLDLNVDIQFPRFIMALPNNLLQNTGDTLLRQIVRQVSNRLTRKVQEDFCQAYAVPLPRRPRRWFFQKSEDDTKLLLHDDA